MNFVTVNGTLLHYDASGEMYAQEYEDSVLTSELTAATIRGADLSRAKIANAFVMQTDLTDAILRGTKFMRANLTGKAPDAPPIAPSLPEKVFVQ